MGTPFTHAVHPDDRTAALNAWAAARATGFPFRAEFRVLRHDGQYRTVQADGHPPRHAQGGAEWTVGCTDLHDRMQAVRSLAARAPVLKGIVDANADSIKILSPDLRRLSMNVGGRRVMEVDDLSACLNAVWPDFWQGDLRPLV
ncbi:PAS domain-containing protein [Deinococcus sp.]|uniref:PAS domain-containing protein n=1 Tax=Deinococcus sp. TaxID=47478 RepID=UPI002869CF48|nr:PAS domain-containing protein [Deinococcus sp.]